jgi:flagellar hook-associated protein 2
MDSSISYQLGIGSGLDINALVKQLSDADKAPKQAAIDSRKTLNDKRISTLAQISSGLDNFSNALTSLISGGTLFTQPTVSDSSILSAKAVAGARIGDLAAEIEVVQLAKAQTLESTRLAARTDAVGQGTLTLTTAAGSVDIVIDSSNDSLDGLAKAINAAGRGVQASVVTDGNGARLVLKGQTGAASAFSLSVPSGTASGLQRFAYGAGVTGGMSRAQQAQDAIVNMDGVQVSRSSNSFSDLIEGVQIDLGRAAPGSIVSIGSQRPTSAIGQGVNDFVAAYNELAAMLADATKAGTGDEAGVLRTDVGVRDMRAKLSQLTSAKLTLSGEGPHTLAELGVRTNRDGTLSVDSFRLTAALTDFPDAVEAMFNPSQWSSNSAVAIVSKQGKVAPGVYTLTDLVPASGGTAASGKVDGLAMSGVDTNLVAPSGSAALGLIVRVDGAAPSVTITVEAGLGGALAGIRNALRATNGAFATSGARLTKEKTSIEDAETTLTTHSTAYYDRLLGSFTRMEKQVSSFKATQSYLDQQIKMWTNSGNN